MTGPRAAFPAGDRSSSTLASVAATLLRAVHDGREVERSVTEMELAPPLPTSLPTPLAPTPREP
jgi:hypothetical protein